MSPDIHEQARRLIDTLHVEGISAADRDWLEAHQAECVKCQAWARAGERALQAVRMNAIKINPAVISATHDRVRQRSRELQEHRARLQALWLACGLSWVLGILTAPLLWQAIAWLGRQLNVSQAIWITAFAVAWVAPATVVGAVMAWRHSHASGLRCGNASGDR